MLSSVLLPEPDGPMSAVSSPGPTVRSMPSSARVRPASPYSLTTPSTTSRTGSAIADRRRRIEACRAPRRDRPPRAGRRRSRAPSRTRTARHRAGPGNFGAPLGSRASASNSFENSAPSADPTTEPTTPEDAALDQEHQQDPARRRADRAQDADLARLLHDRDDEHAGDAERDREDHEELDHPLRARLRRQPGQSSSALIVIQLSAWRPVRPSQLRRDALGVEHVGDLELDRGHAAGERVQRLGVAQRRSAPTSSRPPRCRARRCRAR